jgi:hypothetical protein
VATEQLSTGRGDGITRFAQFSYDGRYRYSLARRWAPRGASGDGALWVMLNPSTADQHEDDATIRRCIGFSKAWGMESLMVLNLFALVATDPRELLAATDPVGGDATDKLLADGAREARAVIVAWGAWGSKFPGRVRQVEELLRSNLFYAQRLRCLGKTANGQPRHPVRLAGDTKLEVFRG